MCSVCNRVSIISSAYSGWAASIPRYRDHGEKLTPFEYLPILSFLLLHFSNCFDPTFLLQKAYAEAEDTAGALAVVASVGGRWVMAEAMRGEVSAVRRR